MPGGWHDRSAALDRRRNGCCDGRRIRGAVAAFHPGHFHRHAHGCARRSVLRDQGRQPRRPRLRGGSARGRRRPCGGRGRAARPLSQPTPRCSSCPTCSTGCAISRALRGRARRRRSSPSPARSARPAPRRRCGSRCARDGETHASVASYNNHWGVPLSLARCPATARYAVFEIGMNHAGEIEPLTRLVRPHVAIITTVEPVHLEFFASIEAIADAKAEIFFGLEPGGAAVINRDNPQFARLRARARRTPASRASSRSASTRNADARLIRCALQAEGSTVEAQILGTDVTYKLGAPGRHLVLNSLAVLAAAALVGADLALAALALAELQPATRARRALRPRRARRAGAADRRELQRQSGLDARGTRPARPGRRRAARPAHRGARRHARARPAGRASSTANWPMAVLGARDRSRVLLRSADARALGGSSLAAGGAAMPRPRPRSNRTCLPPSQPATPSWSRDRSAPAWRPSSRRCEGRYRRETPRAARAQVPTMNG